MDGHNEGDHGVDEILDYAIHYVQCGAYPPHLSKEKKRSVRKRSEKLVVERGEVFLVKKGKKVSVITFVVFKRCKCMFIIIYFAYVLCSMCFCYYNYEEHKLKYHLHILSVTVIFA